MIVSKLVNSFTFCVILSRPLLDPKRRDVLESNSDIFVAVIRIIVSYSHIRMQCHFCNEQGL